MVSITTSDIKIACEGTKGHPITTAAQDFEKAEITDTGGFNLVSSSAYVVICDFKVTHAASRAKSPSGTKFL
jgi:poly(beta-D-mannuronate) lyase